jgi:Ser/Thr protein kinase RdoA (MazF antagonist)
MAELGPFLEDRAEAFPGALEYLSGLAGRLGGRLAGLPQPMDWGYCHGDFRAANLRLYDDAGAVTAFDFELGGTGFRAYDLAYFRASTLHPVALEALWGGAPEPEDHEASWQAFVEGYAGRRPLSPADLWAVPLLVALWALRMLGDIARASEAARRGGSGGGVAEVWPPIPPGGGLPGGDLFERALRFLRDWEASCL